VIFNMEWQLRVSKLKRAPVNIGERPDLKKSKKSIFEDARVRFANRKDRCQT